jgi:hypothetical protein
LRGRDRRRRVTELVMHDEREDDAASQSGRGGYEDLRQRKPGATRGFNEGLGDGEGGVSLLYEEDDLAAIGAVSQMCERGEALVLG